MINIWRSSRSFRGGGKGSRPSPPVSASGAEADDGKPVYMLNLIRFYSQLRTFAGAPEFKGTPEEANAYYEKKITPLWLSHAAYPIFAGASQAKNLINIHPEREWGRAVVCRYPSRRSFLKL